MAHLYAGMARCLSPSFACARLVETGTASPVRPGSRTQLTLPESGSSPQKQRCTIISCCTSEAKSSLWQESSSLIPARMVHSCRVFIPWSGDLPGELQKASGITHIHLPLLLVLSTYVPISQVTKYIWVNKVWFLPGSKSSYCASDWGRTPPPCNWLAAKQQLHIYHLL